MRICDREAVAALGQAMARRVGEPRYKFWFEQNTRFRWDGDQLVVGVPNHFFQEWIQDTFGAEVRSAAQEVLGEETQVRFTIDPELFQAVRRAQNEVAPTARPALEAQRGPGRSPAAAPVSSASETAVLDKPRSKAAKRTRRWHRLGEFVVGSCNRVAYASALNVVEAPGQEINPLVFHGPVGTGKTHLLEGIYAGWRKKNPSWRVCFVTAESFTNRFVHGLRTGKLGEFRKHFRECDALLLDDLNFLATRRASREEFLHTFDALHAEGKQVVLTCDCHPRLSDEYPPELLDRLLGGGIWSLAPPDADTRLALLRAKSSRTGCPLNEETLRFLAGQLRGNVRELEGALNSVGHLSRVTSRPIDMDLVREALGEVLRHSIKLVQLPDVDRAVCAALKLDAGTLQLKQRVWSVSHPRMLAMYLARRHTPAAFSEIGRHFGGLNHASVVAAEKKVRQWLDKEGCLTLGNRRFRVRDLLELIERELRR